MRHYPSVTPKLSRAAKLALEFSQGNVKLFALLSDRAKGHLFWSKDIRAYSGGEPTENLTSPIVNKNRKFAILLGVLDSEERMKKTSPMTHVTHVWTQ